MTEEPQYVIVVCDIDKYKWREVYKSDIDHVLDETQKYLLQGYAVRVEEAKE